MLLFFSNSSISATLKFSQIFIGEIHSQPTGPHGNDGMGRPGFGPIRSRIVSILLGGGLPVFDQFETCFKPNCLRFPPDSRNIVKTRIKTTFKLL